MYIKIVSEKIAVKKKNKKTKTLKLLVLLVLEGARSNITGNAPFRNSVFGFGTHSNMTVMNLSDWSNVYC